MKAIRVFLLMFLLPQCYVLAQYPPPVGPFNYAPIFSTSPDCHVAAEVDYNYMGYYPNQITTAASFDLQSLQRTLGTMVYPGSDTPRPYDDCLAVSVVFDELKNPETSYENKLLVAFEYDTKKLLEIRYSESTVIIKRYNHEKMINNQPSFYEYKLFDPLFPRQNATMNSYGRTPWLVTVFFTSNFMLIVTTDRYSVDKYYMSPIYFGLDFKNMLTKDSNNQFIDNGSYMYKFLKRDLKAKIIVGDIRVDLGPYISDGTQIYSLCYVNYPYDKSKRDSKDKRKNLWWHIQGNLSSPVGEPNN